jgi:hypothetical protein
MPLNSGEMRERIAETAADSVLSYIEMSDVGPWEMPEFWMQCEVARVLKGEFCVGLEIGPNDLLGDAEPAADPLPNWKRMRGVDLVIYGKDACQRKGRAPFHPCVGLVEFKRFIRNPDSQAACRNDAERMRDIAKKVSSVESALFVAYFKNTSKQLVAERKIVSNTVNPVAETWWAFEAEHSDRHVNAVFVCELLPDALSVSRAHGMVNNEAR